MRSHFDIFVAASVLLVAVIGSTSAYRKLCLTGDNFITGVYMANDTETNYVDVMRHASQVRKFDCVKMPPNPTVIAVEAFNKNGWAGILSYETGVGAPYRDWKCAAAADITDPDWMTTDYDDSHWAAAKHFGLVWHRNRELAFVRRARKHHAYSWVWTSRVHDKFKHVYCRLKLCDDNCKSCTVAGPGYCDPGMCTMGSQVDPDPVSNPQGLDRCNHKCCLKINSWGPPLTDRPLFVKVTDAVTGSVQSWPGDIWNTEEPGHYGGLLNMGNCTVMYPVYNTIDEEAANLGAQAYVANNITKWVQDVSYDGGIAFDFWVANASCPDPFVNFLCGIPNVQIFTLPNNLFPTFPWKGAGYPFASLFSGCNTGVQFLNSSWTDLKFGGSSTVFVP